MSTRARPAALATMALLASALGTACGATRPEPRTPAALVESLRGHRHSVTSLALSDDGQWLVSGSRDGTLRVWNAETGAPAAVLSRGWRLAVWAVAISRDGALAAGGSDDFVVRVWDVGRRALRAELEGHGESIRS